MNEAYTKSNGKSRFLEKCSKAYWKYGGKSSAFKHTKFSFALARLSARYLNVLCELVDLIRTKIRASCSRDPDYLEGAMVR